MADLRKAKKSLHPDDREPAVESVYEAAIALLQAREALERAQHTYDAALAGALGDDAPRGRQSRLTAGLGLTRDALRQAVQRHVERLTRTPHPGQ